MGFFVNEHERRPRAPWRLLFQVFVYFAVQLAFGVLALAVLALASGGSSEPPGGGIGLGSSPLALVLGGLLSLVAALVSVWLAGRFLDRRPFSGFGLGLSREWWIDLGFGLLLGAVLMTSIFLVELAAGWVRITGTFATGGGTSSFPLAILAPLVLFLCVGFGEELVSRGYQLKNMAEGLDYPGIGPRGAILLAWVLSSSVFGLAHLANPGSSLVSTINIAFAGLLLGVGYVLTGRLAIPIGLHITWNFFQGNVFGFPVSGMDDIGASFIEISQGGPTFLTGGPFGPEAGLVDIVASVAGSLLIVLWVRLRSGKATLQTSIAEPPVRKHAVS
ncbi:CPBP family intramembrane metalloprotease [Rubrobacter marinus]|uniref:CPBP family intramembrane metalloprotease n=1 Tax=Rubrobacter marinus TaxID=2653852 RepID=A0A6G8PUX1_9ACTN|nr:CPBP family intramembrane glutamic endopeptidase [Rubrobacter marinus]QIN77825.1 CPBP family intramembrane metalloprotease [Rubrobacter marinus]